MALPHRQADLSHLVAGLEAAGQHKPRQRAPRAVLTLPGRALPKQLRLTGLAERMKELFRAKSVYPPEDAVAVVPEAPRSTLASSAEKKSYGPCRGLVMAKEVGRMPKTAPTPTLKAVLEPDDEVKVPAAPPPSLLVPLSSGPVTEEESEVEATPRSSLNPSVSEMDEECHVATPATPAVLADVGWSRWRPWPAEMEPERSWESPVRSVLECGGTEGVMEEGSMDVIARFPRHVEVIEEGKSVDYTLSKSSCSTEAFEHYSRRPSALQEKQPHKGANSANLVPFGARYVVGIGRPPRLPPWSLRFYKPEALPRVSVSRPVEKVEPEMEPPVIRPPRRRAVGKSKGGRDVKHMVNLPSLAEESGGEQKSSPSERRLQNPPVTFHEILVGS